MDKVIINRTINYPTLIVSGVVAVISCSLLHFNNAATLDNYLKVLSLLVTATALVYTAINVNYIRKDGEVRNEFARKEFSSRLINEFNSPEMTALVIISRQVRSGLKDLTPAQAEEHIRKDSNTELSIVTLLNYYEKLAIAIEQGIADEIYLKSFFKTMVISTYGTLRVFIEKLRADRSNPKIFKSFEDLSLRWGKD